MTEENPEVQLWLLEMEPENSTNLREESGPRPTCGDESTVQANNQARSLRWYRSTPTRPPAGRPHSVLLVLCPFAHLARREKRFIHSQLEEK